MKTLSVFFLALLLTLPSLTNGQNDIVIGTMDSIESEVLGEERKLLIHVPNEGPNSIFAKQNYPVIYLLDGDAHFTSIVGIMEQLSSINGNTIMPKMIIVGIPNTNRTRDLTPSKAQPNPPMAPKNLVDQSGGGKNFLKFMEQELFPYIESKYDTAPYRMLIGHSFGGLFVMDALFDQPELFQGYISIDPSMWWDDSKLLNAYKNANLKDDKYKNKSLYLGIANTLEAGLDTITTRKTKGPMTAHINSIFDIRDELRNKKKSNILFQSAYYDKDSHGSAPLITAYDGLRFIFEFYQIDINFADVMEGKSNIVEDLNAHYAKVSKTLGYENKPDESFVNGMGYQLMQMNKLELAAEFFNMNVKNYPESYNVYDSLGDYYMAVDNKEEAKKSFMKALSIQENPASREKYEKLKSD